jgi:type I restriction enzyme S subunit
MDLIPSGNLSFSAFNIKDAASISSGTYFEEGDLLLSKITPCFENGKQGIAVSIPNGFGFATTEVIPIKARDGITHLPFVAYYVLHQEVRSLMAASMEGATGRQRLPKDVLAEWPVPIPPMEEQRAIAGLLEDIQSAVRIQSAIARMTGGLKAATMTKLLREGLRGKPLKESAVGPIPESWDVVRLGTLAKVGNGSTPSRTNEAYWQDGVFPWITSTKVHEVFVRAADELVSETALRECHLPVVPKGSLVVAITGQGKTLGNAALLEIDTCVNQHLAYIRFLDERPLPEFLLFWLQSQYQFFRDISTSGGSTKGALTCGFLANLSVPVPSSDEQREIADLLVALTKRQHIAEKNAQVTKDLFTTALHQLMTGTVRIKGLESVEVVNA